MKKTIKPACILFFLMLIHCADLSAQASHRVLPPNEFEAKAKIFKTSPILDVRTPEEFANGHIPGAININWLSGGFEIQTGAIDTLAPVFLYCLEGGRSAEAAESMERHGFKEVYVLKGGILKWRSSNLPEVAPPVESDGMSKVRFDELLKRDNTVLIVFFARWCAECKKIKPGLDQIATEMADSLRIFWINVDNNRDLCNELKIDAIPVVQLYQNQKMSWSKTGFVRKSAIVKQIELTKNPRS